MKSLKPHYPSRNVTQYLAISVLAFAALAFQTLGQSVQRGGIDWILVLDTSASMRGAGGTKDIFDRVKNTLKDFIRSAREDDSITIYTYDRDTKLHPTVHIADETDKRDLLVIIDDLQANGDRTHTGKAIHDALVRADELSKRPGASSRTTSIVLLTDGLEDVRGLSNPLPIPSNITLIPKEQPYIFFVSLGEREHEKQVEDFVNHPALGGKGEVIRDPGADGIEQVGDRIRKKLEAPPTPTEITLSIKPSSVDFGQIEPGENTGRQTVAISTNVATSAHLTLDDPLNSGISLIEPQESLDLKANESTTIKVRLATVPGLPDNTYTAHLILSPVGPPNDASVKIATAEVRVSVAHVPAWRKALKWLAIALIALVLVLIALSLIKGEPPWIWLPTIVKADKKLEGEIEIIKPRPAQVEDEFVSLLKRESERLTLSSLVPDGATADSDAELIAIRKNGQKCVQLRRTQGVVQVNHAEIASTELFDGDIIDLGETRLRFNWVGHERAVDSDENI